MKELLPSRCVRSEICKIFLFKNTVLIYTTQIPVQKDSLLKGKVSVINKDFEQLIIIHKKHLQYQLSLL